MKKHANNQKILIEIGSGQTIPTIRTLSEKLYYQYDNLKIIRINPDPSASAANWLNPDRYVDVQLSAL